MMMMGCDFECGLPSRGLATLGLLRRGDDGGRTSDPLGSGDGSYCYGPPVSCGWVHLFLELIAHGSPRYSRETGFLKKAEVFLHLWLINPQISHGIIGETGLLGDWL